MILCKIIFKSSKDVCDLMEGSWMMDVGSRESGSDSLCYFV